MKEMTAYDRFLERQRIARERAIEMGYWKAIEDALVGGGIGIAKDGKRIDPANFYSEQPAVPEGWKLVPVEPTKEMIDRGRIDNSIQGRALAEACYRAMLAAAPTPTQGETK